MSLKTVLGALRGQTSSDNETTPKIKIEFPLDRAVKWLCLRAVGALATFLIAMFEFFKGKPKYYVFLEDEPSQEYLG